MLGDAIAESGGPELLAEVEALRKATIAYRRPTHRRPSPSRDGAGRGLRPGPCRGRDPGVHVLLPAGQPGGGTSPRPDAARIGAAPGSRSSDSIAALDGDPASVRDLRITPVLTAHPTEAKRRAVVEHLWRIGALLEQLEDRSLGVSEEQEIRRRMREEIAGLWRTDPIRRHRPEPLDEVRAVLALFDQTIFTTLPGRLPRDGSPARPGRLRHAAAVVRTVPAMGHVGRRRSRRQPARDRRGDARGDGDPIRSRVARAGGRLAADRADAVGLGRTTSRPSRALRRALDRDAEALARRRPGARADALRRAASAQARAVGAPAGRDPHRRQRRVRRPGVVPDATWTSCNGRWTPAARRDWHGASCSTCAGRSRRSASTWRRWRSGSIRRCWRPRERSSRSPRSARPSAPTREVLATFRAIADIQSRLGVQACERVVVSFTRSAADLAGVLALARAAVPGVASRRGAGGAPRVARGAHHRGVDPGRLAGDARRDAGC